MAEDPDSEPDSHLPSEVKAMTKEETVCRFCGVSYLIFKEVKMLEKKLKSAEACLRLACC